MMLWCVVLVLCLLLWCVCWVRPRLRGRGVVVGFFHPYCAAGGGGERVLWAAVAALSARQGPDINIVIYTGDDLDMVEMRSKVLERFGLEVPTSVKLQRIRGRWLIEAKFYPVVTLLGQSLGSMVLGLECLLRYPPDIWIDTTGCAFPYFLARYLCGCRVACYVHYPTISADMIQAVEKRNPNFNHRGIIARSTILTFLKLYYYRMFAYFYGVAGRRASAVTANSTWTKNHIAALWNLRPTIVYPPCDTKHLRDYSQTKKKPLVLSLAQFRPEKNHITQLEAWALVPEKLRGKATFIIAGATRHRKDEELLGSLQRKCHALGLNDSVTFLKNADRSQLVALLREASVGLHTMKFEHFGIAIVEMMAAGCVPVAHASAGPLLDIVGRDRDRGYVCDTPQEYADAINTLLTNHNTRQTMAKNAQTFVETRFSDKAFKDNFISNIIEPLLLPS